MQLINRFERNFFAIKRKINKEIDDDDDDDIRCLFAAPTKCTAAPLHRTLKNPATNYPGRSQTMNHKTNTQGLF